MANRDKNKNHVIPKDAFDHAIVTWYAPQFLRFRRGWIWYLLAALFDAAFLVYAIYTQSWTMAAVFAVLPVVYLIENRSKPEPVQVIVSQYGIKFGVFKIAFSDMRGFWVLHEPPYVDELHLLTNNKLHPEITIPLVGTDPTTLRQYLVTQIPEIEGKKQDFMDVLTRFFRLN